MGLRNSGGHADHFAVTENPSIARERWDHNRVFCVLSDRRCPGIQLAWQYGLCECLFQVAFLPSCNTIHSLMDNTCDTHQLPSETSFRGREFVLFFEICTALELFEPRHFHLEKFG